MLDVALQLIASALTVITMWRYGDKDRRAPLWGLGAEAVWVVMVFVGGLWGLLPLWVITTTMQIRNWLKWRQDGSAPV